MLFWHIQASNRELFHACFSAAVETQASGLDALALLRDRQELNHQFDLVLSDVYMPGGVTDNVK